MVDDDGRTPDHGHPISSPCEPNGSGELKRALFNGRQHVKRALSVRDGKQKGTFMHSH